MTAPAPTPTPPVLVNPGVTAIVPATAKRVPALVSALFARDIVRPAASAKIKPWLFRVAMELFWIERFPPQPGARRISPVGARVFAPAPPYASEMRRCPVAAPSATTREL